MKLFDDQGVELSPQSSAIGASKTYNLIEKVMSLAMEQARTLCFP